MRFLIPAALTATPLTVAPSVVYLVIAVTNNPHEEMHPFTVISLTLIGILGIASGGTIIWSDLHEGRCRVRGLVFSAFFFLVSITVLIFHLYWPSALMLLVLAAWNFYKWRDKGES